MRGPARLLMTADTVGGVWTYALELARGFVRHGTEVLIAVPGPAPSPTQWAEVDTVPGLGVALVGRDLEWRDRKGADAELARRLRALERAFAPEIVHVNGFRDAASGFQAPVVLVAHSCVRTWWRACRGEDLPGDWNAYIDGVRRGLAAASMLVGPTRAFLTQFEEAWGICPRRRVIRNGLDLDMPTSRRRPTILAAGRMWDEAKNVRALVELAPELPWPVAIAGDAPEGGLGTGVQALGRLSRVELVGHMARAGIFCSPARYEPFGLGVLEAALAGCPLVLGATPSLIELWGNAAHFVPPNDRDALQGALEDLIADEEARRQLGRAAREKALRFSRTAMVQGYLRLYTELAMAGAKVA